MQQNQCWKRLTPSSSSSSRPATASSSFWAARHSAWGWGRGGVDTPKNKSTEYVRKSLQHLYYVHTHESSTILLMWTVCTWNLFLGYSRCVSWDAMQPNQSDRLSKGMRPAHKHRKQSQQQTLLVFRRQQHNPRWRVSFHLFSSG